MVRTWEITTSSGYVQPQVAALNVHRPSEGRFTQAIALFSDSKHDPK